MADEWTQVTGEAGRVYYLNHATGETSWLKPAAAKLTEEPLPDGWVEKKARAGNKYYFNPVTGETSYDRPTRDAAQMAVEKAAAEQRVKEQEVGASQLQAAAVARVAREVESAGVAARAEAVRASAIAQAEAAGQTAAAAGAEYAEAYNAAANADMAARQVAADPLTLSPTARPSILALAPTSTPIPTFTSIHSRTTHHRFW